MKVLLVGSGGREHALAWKLARSPSVTELVAAPGNAGIAEVARLAGRGAHPDDLLRLAEEESVDLVVIGPEAPLVAGLSDSLRERGIAAFGPGEAGARLEGSKAYAKEFMARYGVPTAQHRTFVDQGSALDYLRLKGAPVVVKDSGLAAGKGVTVAEEEAEAEEAVRRIFAGSRHEPRVVIEERLQGQEFSYLVFTDGETYRPMPIAQDYKQAEEGDLGPMTGGMGTVAPVGLLDATSREQVEREIVERTLAGLSSEGIDYRGVLYFGLMLTDAGPRLLEYNVRFGDPETQVVVPLLDTDLVEVMLAVAERRLGELELSWRQGSAACVVMAAPGYPAAYRRGIPITTYEPTEDLLLFHAGTERREGRLVSSGGRVLDVVGLAEGTEEAVLRAYQGVAMVDFPGAHYRKDIGSRLLGRRP
ncbi:MAG TPA: phosphoribosylamine--glycine ligase [Trueperaceae bacterium]